jgi:MscS family membrane protein
MTSSAPLLRRIAAPLLAVLFLLAPAAAMAQFARPAPAAAPTPGAPEEPVGDAYGRETARGCLLGFLRAVERGNMENAAAYLQIPPSLKGSRAAIARQLQIVFDRRFVTANMDRISRHPRGGLEDGLPPEQERVGEVRGSDGRIEVIAVRQEAQEGPAIWLISWETVRACRQLYDELDLLDIDRALPPTFSKTRVGAMSLWQVLAFLLLLPVLFVVSGVLVGAILHAARLLRRTAGPPGEAGSWTAPARQPATFILTLFLHRITVMWLGMPVLYRLYYDRVILLLLFVGLFWLLARLIDALNSRLLARVLPAGAAARGPTLSLAPQALKLVAFLLVVLLALAAFGVNLTATLTGLGIGGIALAFAAQKSLENFFGGIAILADKGRRSATPASGPTGADRGHHALGHPDPDAGPERGQHSERPDERVADREPDAARQVLVPSHGRSRLPDDGGADARGPRGDPRVARRPSARRGGDHPGTLSDPWRLVARRGGLCLRARRRVPGLPGRQEELLLRILEIVSAAGTSVAFPSQTVYLEGTGAGKESAR